MEKFELWSTVVSMVTGVMTIFAFIGVFVKMGKDKGVAEAIQKEMRKDIDENAKDINCLGQKVNQMEVENTKLISTLSSDLGWIKSNLNDIKSELLRKEN